MEMLARMFGDTLWIYTAIGGSIIGAADHGMDNYVRCTKVE